MQRGFTLLDKSKPRELWQWGDIYQEEARLVETIKMYQLGEDLDNKLFLGLKKQYEQEHIVAERLKR